MKKLIYFAASLLFIFTSCTKDSPEKNTKVGFSIRQQTTLSKSDGKNKTVVNPLSRNISFSKVLFGVSDISVLQKSEISEKEISFNGSYVFDVLNGTSTPPIVPVEAEPGMYSEVKFKIDNVLPDGNSIVIFGKYENNNIAFDFEFTADITHEFDIKNENGLQITEGDIKEFILYIDLKSLFDGIDITTLKFDSDNVVRINLSSNPELSALINSNFNSAMQLDLENHN